MATSYRTFCISRTDLSLTAIVREATVAQCSCDFGQSIAAARQALATEALRCRDLGYYVARQLGPGLLPVEALAGGRTVVIISYTADEPSRSLRSAVDAPLVKSRGHSVTQLMVTVLAQIDGADIRESRRAALIHRRRRWSPRLPLGARARYIPDVLKLAI